MRKLIRFSRVCLAFSLMACCVSCGFHLQNSAPLAPPLHRLYLRTNDPYGSLARYLTLSLKLSKVTLVPSPQAANTILEILEDNQSETMLSVNGTQQTRQYNLHLTVTFQVTDRSGRVLLDPQTLTQDQPITVQANQVLSSSNELNLFYQQMRRSIASTIMYRLSSAQVSQIIMTRSQISPPPHSE